MCSMMKNNMAEKCQDRVVSPICQAVVVAGKSNQSKGPTLGLTSTSLTKKWTARKSNIPAKCAIPTLRLPLKIDVSPTHASRYAVCDRRLDAAFGSASLASYVRLDVKTRFGDVNWEQQAGDQNPEEISVGKRYRNMGMAADTPTGLEHLISQVLRAK